MSEFLQPPRPYSEIRVYDELVLREVPLVEAGKLFEITEQNREYLGRWLPWVEKTLTTADSEFFLKGVHSRRDAGENYGFGFYVDGELAGHASLMNLSDDTDKEPEIGYWITEAYAGRGITTKAAQALTDFALKTLGLDTVIIRAEPDNVASNKIAEKLGYAFRNQDIYEENGKVLNVWVKKKL